MSDYNRAARLYWFASVALGAVACIWALVSCLAFSAFEWAQLLVLLSLVVISSARPIPIPNTIATVTVADAFIFLGAIFLGSPSAVLLGIIDSFRSSRRTSRRITSWLLAPAVMGLSVLVASRVFYWMLELSTGHRLEVVGTSSPLGLGQLLLPLVSMALAQYLVNGSLVALFSSLKSGRSVWQSWRDGYLWTSWTFFAGAMAAGFVYEAIKSFGLLYVLLSVPVIAATYATYKTYFDRVNEQTREAAETSRIHLATVEALATAIDAKDQTTHCHVRRVQLYTARMGELMGLSPSEIKALKAGALLHDIGKLAVPDHILNKPGKLTAAEFDKMKIHTSVGAQILERVNFPYPVVPIVRSHHERWDGEGYPDNLKGEEIPITARILSVVDCFDSVREDRPYRRGRTREEATQLLQQGAGTHFDPRVVELFIKHLPEFEREVATLGLNQHGFTNEECEPRALLEGASYHSEAERRHQRNGKPREGEAASATPTTFTPPAYLDQIKDAHREVYALYEIASTFGSSLDIEETVSVLVNKVGHIVPFDTCAVYLFDEIKGYATAAHVAGRNAAALRERCVAPGEGVVGFVLANRLPATQFDAMLDFVGVELEPDTEYRSMIALPLVKDERMLGAIAVYSFEPRRYTGDHTRILDTIVHLASDAVANAIHHAETKSNALTDTLTGLPNARSLHLRFDQEASRARRTRRPFQVIMLDLDHFKQVNDTFGHKTGDHVLREMARILQAQLREYDFLARYAGDEFVAIVQDTNAEQVSELSERIETAVSRFALRVRPDNYARVGISVGAATYGTDGDTLDQLLIAADKAMYSVKSDHKQQERTLADKSALNTDTLASTAIN
ncbi:MAG TPA: diguanylate cyclase [Pyrinomonadaceae bacterium]|jgi:diguanylate cyclase (GGDEF)-like protein/putative nucleotidyltransferase with HDIG domain